MKILTAHKISDQRGWHFYEVRARDGDQIEVVAVCDDRREAREFIRAARVEEFKTRCDYHTNYGGD